jgi:hypothetical protein
MNLDKPNYGLGIDYGDRLFHLVSVRASGVRIDWEGNSYIDLSIHRRKEGNDGLDVKLRLFERAEHITSPLLRNEARHPGYRAKLIHEEFLEYGKFSEPIKYDVELPYQILYKIDGTPRGEELSLRLVGAYLENAGLHLETGLPEDLEVAFGKLGNVPRKLQIHIYPVSDTAQKTLSLVDAYINRWR